MTYLHCGKCGGQMLWRTEIDYGFSVREQSCLQCGWSGDPPPLPDPEDTHQRRSRRGGGHLGSRTPLEFEAD